MSHSPEPWTYDADLEWVRDANGHFVADVRCNEDSDTQHTRADANGHRIAALSAENAALKAQNAALRRTLYETHEREHREDSDRRSAAGAVVWSEHCECQMCDEYRAALSRPEAGT